MDLDADGRRDVISGAYWPGDIVVFREREDGTFAAATELLMEDGTKLNAGEPWEKEDEPRMESLASAPHAVDYDGDGDLDMLIGNIIGQIVLIENTGTKQEPVWSTNRRTLEAGGKTILVGQGDHGGNDSGPTTADWDGDGRWDLIVGGGDGVVKWFRNAGTAEAPSFEAGRTLIEPSGHEPIAHGEEPKRSGTRTKVHAVDYDGDGDLDLLVGDFISLRGPEPKLSDEQRAEKAELEERRAELEKRFAEDLSDDDMQKLTTEFSALFGKLRKLEAEQKPTGFVWLYTRSGSPATAQGGQR